MSFSWLFGSSRYPKMADVILSKHYHRRVMSFSWLFGPSRYPTTAGAVRSKALPPRSDEFELAVRVLEIPEGPDSCTRRCSHQANSEQAHFQRTTSLGYRHTVPTNIADPSIFKHESELSAHCLMVEYLVLTGPASSTPKLIYCLHGHEPFHSTA